MATQNLILALGSNLGDKKTNLRKAQELLQSKYEFVEASRIYTSKAVDVENQPDFFNQIIHFSISDRFTPTSILNTCLQIETEMGRIRTHDKGPRIIDIDIIFIDEQIVQNPKIQIPHPHWKNRSFVVRPLMELAIWKKIRRNFPLPAKIEFQIEAIPLK